VKVGRPPETESAETTEQDVLPDATAGA
jgi:hypothetical protein